MKDCFDFSKPLTQAKQYDCNQSFYTYFDTIASSADLLMEKTLELQNSIILLKIDLIIFG